MSLDSYSFAIIALDKFSRVVNRYDSAMLRMQQKTDRFQKRIDKVSFKGVSNKLQGFNNLNEKSFKTDNVKRYSESIQGLKIDFDRLKLSANQAQASVSKVGASWQSADRPSYSYSSGGTPNGGYVNSVKPSNDSSPVRNTQVVNNSRRQGLGSRFTKALKKSNSGVSVGGVGVVAALGGVVSQSAAISDAQGDVMKTTGLTQKQVEQLQSQINKFDTRTMTHKLLAIGEVGGQMGVGKKELSGFIKATDQAVVALGKEFGGSVEAVASTLGKLKGLYGTTNVLQYGDAINKIGSTLNALGAAGNATSPEMANFAKRLGALGKLKPTITQTLGLAAALEESGIGAEIGAGGLTNIFLTAGKETSRFAKQMGLTENQFKSLLNTSPNQMLLHLAQSMKGLNNTQVVQVMNKLKIGSQESIKVLSILANKTNLVKEKQKLASLEFAKGTSLTNEFNIKNNTFAGKLDKMKKSIALTGLTIGKKLIPSITLLATKATGFFTWASRNWSKLTPFFVGVGIAIGIMAVKMIALNIAMAANPVGAVVTGIALLAAGFTYIWQKSETFRRAMNSAWQDMKRFAGGVKQDFASIFADVQSAFGGASNKLLTFNTIAGLVGVFFRTIINRVLLALRGFSTFFSIIIDGAISTFKFFYHFFAGIFSLITFDVDGFKDHFNSAIGSVGDFFLRTFQKIKRFFGGFISGFIDRTSQALQFIGIISKKDHELATKGTRDFFGLDKKTSKKNENGKFVKVQKDDNKTSNPVWIIGGLNTSSIELPSTSNPKLKKVVKSPNEARFLPNVSTDGQGFLGNSFKRQKRNIGIQSVGGDLGGNVSTDKAVKQNISIHIDNLVREFNVVTNNINEATGDIKGKIIDALLGAVNDVNIIA